MYAIFEDGGRQYRVSEGDHVLVDVRELPEGQKDLTFDKVLLVGDGAASRIGTPFVSGAKVSAKIVGELQMPKVIGIKMRRRKGYKKKWGHRQDMLRVEVSGIKA